jgi:hypothetical protein
LEKFPDLVYKETAANIVFAWLIVCLLGDEMEEFYDHKPVASIAVGGVEGYL